MRNFGQVPEIAPAVTSVSPYASWSLAQLGLARVAILTECAGLDRAQGGISPTDVERCALDLSLLDAEIARQQGSGSFNISHQMDIWRKIIVGNPPTSDEEALGGHLGSLLGVVTGWASGAQVPWIKSRSWVSRLVWPISLGYTGRRVGRFIGRRLAPEE